MPRDYGIKILLEHNLSINIFMLHITNGNSHDATIPQIIDMLGHCGPMLDAFDVVKHNPSIYRNLTFK
jgi:hypothetical protein